MSAGRLSVVTYVEDLADLGKGEPGSLAAVDEVDAPDGVGGVVAVASRGALGGWQQPLLLVEPQRLGSGSRCLGELPDPHPDSLVSQVSLDLPPYWKVHSEHIRSVSQPSGRNRDAVEV